MGGDDYLPLPPLQTVLELAEPEGTLSLRQRGWQRDPRRAVLWWDEQAVAAALRISPQDVRRYFTDGRRMSFLLERRIAREILFGQIAPSEGAGYDVVDAAGKFWEIRSLTKAGIYFCPSSMIGAKRWFNEKEFLAKLDLLQGFVVADIECFPAVPYWLLPAERVREWWQAGKLGRTSKINRALALELLGASELSQTV